MSFRNSTAENTVSTGTAVVGSLRFGVPAGGPSKRSDLIMMVIMIYVLMYMYMTINIYIYIYKYRVPEVWGIRRWAIREE
jgi:hypothetical protein